MCCTRLAENTGCKNSPSVHHRTTLLIFMFATKACIDNFGKKLVNHQYLLHMSSQYGAPRFTNGWDWFASLGHPSKFQQVSCLGFVTAPSSLSGITAFKRGYHLYSAGRPSHWASTHILVLRYSICGRWKLISVFAQLFWDTNVVGQWWL